MKNANKILQPFFSRPLMLLLEIFPVFFVAAGFRVLRATDHLEDVGDAIIVLEILKYVFLAYGALLFCHAYSVHLSTVSVLPVRQSDAAKLLFDKLTLLSAIPCGIELITALSCLPDIDSHLSGIYRSPCRPLLLMVSSLLFYALFVTATVLYLTVRPNANGSLWNYTRTGVYLLAAIILGILKSHCDTSALLLDANMALYCIAYAALAAFAILFYLTMIREKRAACFRNA